MKKRILSLLMVLAMVLSLLPMNVLMISAEPAEGGELPAVGSPATNHEHVYRNNYCTVCGAIDPDHECEFGWYDILADKHCARCWLCTEIIGGWEEHTYVDGKCVACGAAEPDHQHVMADDFDYDYWRDDDGHYRYCVICRERMSEKQPHTYDSDGICTVCGCIGPKHVHMFEEGHVSMSTDGHWQYCTICNQSEYADHRYKDGACEICGYMDPDHPHVADEWWHGDARGHYHECEYVACGVPVGGIIPHTYDNYRCTDCGYVNPAHPHDSEGAGYDRNYHYSNCSICGKRMSAGEAHTYVNGYCTVCGCGEDIWWEHTCDTYGWLQGCEFGHYYTCSECGSRSAPVEEHNYVDNHCAVCGYTDPHHTCEADEWMVENNFWYSDDSGHYRYCNICGERMDIHQHPYDSNGVCEVCGYAGPGHTHVNSGECTMSDEKGHYYDCATCNARPFLEPHNYVNGRCEVCRAVDPSHTCVAGERWTYDWDSRYMGHYQTCAICYDRVGEVQHHIYEHGRCIVCELAAPNHVHNYIYLMYGGEGHCRTCTICHDGYELEAHSIDEESGCCKVCGYQRDERDITALSIHTNEHGELIIAQTYADDSTCDMTVTGFCFKKGDGSPDGWTFMAGEIYTGTNTLGSAGSVYYTYWHEDGRFYISYCNNGREIRIDSNILDKCEWFNVYNAAGKENIVNPVCTLDGDVWVVTGTAYDGESVRMTMDGDGNVLTYVVGECKHPTWVENITVQPTCTEAGSKTYTCADCGETYTEEIAALEHHIVMDEAVDATCGEDGHTVGFHCDRCEVVLLAPTVLPATGKHVSTGEHCATVTHRAICDVCDQEYGELLPITCDLNGDDKTDAADLTILLRHVAMIEIIEDAETLAQLDFDQSGDVDAADVTILAQYLENATA